MFFVKSASRLFLFLIAFSFSTQNLLASNLWQNLKSVTSKTPELSTRNSPRLEKPSALSPANSPSGTPGKEDFKPVPKDSIAAATSYSCFLSADNFPLCWGEGRPLQKIPVTDAASVAIGLVSQTDPLGHSHMNFTSACAVKKNGALWCWSPYPEKAPQPIVGLEDIRQVSIGIYKSCALNREGKVFCWDSIEKPPTQEGPNDVKKIVVGSQACALKRDGTVWCWGYNQHGQLGNGTVSEGENPTPTQVFGNGFL